MKGWHQFLNQFLKSQGFWVFSALFIVKILSFFTNILLIRFLPKDQFALLAVVPAVFTIFAPFIGYGYPHALLRYGLLLKTDEEKQNFSAQLFRKGFIFQFFLSLVFFGSAIFFYRKYFGIIPVFAAFSLRLFGLYIFTHLQSEFRISKGNRAFSIFTIINGIFTFFATILLTWKFGLTGYLYATAIAPFICIFWLKNIKIKSPIFYFNNKEINNFSSHIALTNIFSELLFSADILLLSFLANENSVADYRTAILIPSNVVFLAQSFLQASYPDLVENCRDAVYCKNFVRQFYIFFIPISAVIFIISFIFKHEIVHLFFGDKYAQTATIFAILMCGFSFSMPLRVLYGYMLSASGKVSANTLSTLVSVAALILFGCFLVPKFGAYGMAASMVISLFSGGLIGAFSYFEYFKKIK